MWQTEPFRVEAEDGCASENVGCEQGGRIMHKRAYNYPTQLRKAPSRNTKRRRYHQPFLCCHAREEAVRGGESKGTGEVCTSVWFPISTPFQVSSHLMPVKFRDEDTAYVVAMTGVPLLAEQPCRNVSK